MTWIARANTSSSVAGKPNPVFVDTDRVRGRRPRGHEEESWNTSPGEGFPSAGFERPLDDLDGEAGAGSVAATGGAVGPFGEIGHRTENMPELSWLCFVDVNKHLTGVQRFGATGRSP